MVGTVWTTKKSQKNKKKKNEKKNANLIQVDAYKYRGITKKRQVYNNGCGLTM